ncbi:uncharacterized protein [Primulina huaijiensis]|uniref:uncharacterized protein n=1 Tax=Primulina huaijiensis TaxID=1492673 RepID=UPI003CC79025
MFAEAQATRQERKENAEGHQSKVEETQPLQSGEISEMGEIWKEIHMLRQQLGSRAQAPKSGSLFSLTILEEGLPPNFRQSKVGEYNGHIDPEKTLGEPNSIQSFEDFSTDFLHRFVSSNRNQKNYLRLFIVKQQEAKTLQEFVQRFNKAVLKISTATPDIMISAFTEGLRGGEFFKSLVKKPPLSYDDLLARAEKYVNSEDAQQYRRMEHRPGGSRVEEAEKRGGATDGDSRRARKSHGRRFENFEISRGADLPQDPVIRFGPKDLRGVVAPHNDALVVTATVANHDVAQIFIDNGSSMNILLKITLDQMKVEGYEFEPISTPLYGFAGHAIPPLGQIILPLSLGHDPRRVTKMTTFTVVDTPSAYNGILGRPALKDFRAVASTYHHKLKFPVEKKVGVLCVDQKFARQCYEGIGKEEGKRA